MLNHEEIHPGTQALSANYVASVMRSALGDPKLLPLGCPALLQGCAEVLINKFQLDIAIHHADLMRDLMRFVMLPRPRDDVQRYSTPHTIPCRCMYGPSLLRSAPAILHKTSPGRDLDMGMKTAIFSISALLSMCFEALSDKVTCRIFFSQRRRRRRYAQAFPQTVEDILPYGPEASIQSFVINWLVPLDSEPIGYTDIVRLLRHILHSTRYHVLPVIVSAPQLWDMMYRFVKSSIPKLQSGAHRTSQDMLSVLRIFESISDLIMTLTSLTSWDFDTLFHCIRRAYHDGYDEATEFVVNCFTACKALSEQKSFDIPFAEDLRVAYDFFGQFVSHLAYDRYDEIFKHLRLKVSWGKMLRALRDLVEQREPFQQITETVAFMENSQRCAAPACAQTQANLHRKFKRCGGCGIVSYCSISCQRKAWRYRRAPHRAVCLSLGEKLRVVPQVPGSSDMIVEMAGTQKEVEDLINHFTALRTRIYREDGESTS
jgi:hypothetical protein